MRVFSFIVLSLSLVACGGASDPVSNPQPTSGASGGASTPPTAPRPPAAVGSLPQAETTAPFHVYVSNQSFDLDPVDIDIYVDDIKLITGDFLVGSQHNWKAFDFTIEAGKPHTVRAVTTKGGVEKSEVVNVPAAGRWVVVDFWYSAPSESGSTEAPESFSINAYDKQPGFD